MSYKYTLAEAGKMTNQELLNALLAREVAPRTIVGTGYINARQVAIEYLQEEIAKEGECDKCASSYDLSSRDNRCGNCGNCNTCCTHNGEGE
jgi:hypothetical protein